MRDVSIKRVLVHTIAGTVLLAAMLVDFVFTDLRTAVFLVLSLLLFSFSIQVAVLLRSLLRIGANAGLLLQSLVALFAGALSGWVFSLSQASHHLFFSFIGALSGLVIGGPLVIVGYRFFGSGAKLDEEAQE